MHVRFNLKYWNYEELLWRDPTKPQNERKRMYPSVVVVGKRGSGKSVLVENLMYFKRHAASWLVLCPTLTSIRRYKELVGDGFVHTSMTEAELSGIYNTQTAAVQEVDVKYAHLPDEERPYPELVMVLDDQAYNKKLINSELMRQLVMNGRHSKITVILTLQYVMDLQPAIRSNADMIFSLAENSATNREKLYNAFFSCFDTPAQFDAVFKLATADYGALMINTSRISTADKICARFVANPSLPQFIVGSQKNRRRFEERVRDAAVAAAQATNAQTDDNTDERTVPIGQKGTMVIRCQEMPSTAVAPPAAASVTAAAVAAAALDSDPAAEPHRHKRPRHRKHHNDASEHTEAINNEIGQ